MMGEKNFTHQTSPLLTSLRKQESPPGLTRDQKAKPREEQQAPSSRTKEKCGNGIILQPEKVPRRPSESKTPPQGPERDPPDPSQGLPPDLLFSRQGDEGKKGLKGLTKKGTFGTENQRKSRPEKIGRDEQHPNPN